MIVNKLTSILILSQVIKIEMEVQMSNPDELWLYLSDVNSITKQWKEREEDRDNEL